MGVVKALEFAPWAGNSPAIEAARMAATEAHMRLIECEYEMRGDWSCLGPRPITADEARELAELKRLDREARAYLRHLTGQVQLSA